MLRKSFYMLVIAVVCSAALIVNSARPVQAAGEEDLFVNVQPNVLLIFDNSNSMDEDALGNAVGSYHTDSKSVIGRKALIDIVNGYANQMKIGLMTYRLPAASKYYLHNMGYFASYEPKSYCPSDDDAVLAACQNYCKDPTDTTARDTCQAGCRSAAGTNDFDATYTVEGISGSPTSGDKIIRDSTGAKRAKYCGLVYPKTRRITNPSDTSRYIYYKQAFPYYASSDQGRQYFWATSYSSDESTAVGVVVPGVVYWGWGKKTGTEDTHTNYSDYIWNNFQFSPTDSDLALGYGNFGWRLFSYSVGQTWFANSSPGGGYLHVVANYNLSGDAQKTALLNKLATKESDQAGYMTCTETSNPNKCAYIVNAGLTPMEGTFQSAYNYFLGEKDYQTGTKAACPIEDYCQKNFIIYVTDGLPSVDKDGNTNTAAALINNVKAKITALRNITVGEDTFDVQTYVIGVGLTDEAKVHLNALAVAGGTDVNGSAYYANNLADLNLALYKVFESIAGKSFSFSTASVSASRVKDENYLYEASFLPSPLNALEPFWLGYLKQYTIQENGEVNGTSNWDAGLALKNRDIASDSRTIFTLQSGISTSFIASNLSNADLGVSTDTERTDVVDFITKGELDANYKYYKWKLGDVFHSSPKTIGTPSYDYVDQVDKSNPKGYVGFRDAHLRTTTAGVGYGKRIIVVGANDGQLHAFRSTDGREVWSFIAPNLLPQLKNIVHKTHNPIPGGIAHTYFVDGPVSVSDVWLPDTASNGEAKVMGDWYTYMVFGLRQGGESTLWSSDPSCDPGSSFSSSYMAPTIVGGTVTEAGNPYYCGYYGFDVTNTLSPQYKWVLGKNTYNGLPNTVGPYLGRPWSRVALGRIKDSSGNETWVGFIGGGYSGVQHKPPSTSNTKGKGFLMLDVKTGNILWKFTYSDSSVMQYDLAGPPAAVDVDNDGFIDTVYAADVGGNLWRFKFCLRSEGACTWTGSKLFATSTGNIRPIYTSPTIAKDSIGNLWVYFATGDVMDPANASAQERFYAVKDNNRTNTYTLSHLADVTDSYYTPADEASKPAGWYIQFTGGGEKVLADPTVFRGVVYFTTYVPTQSVSSICDKVGEAKLFAIDFTTGKGKFDGDNQSETIGKGLSTNVIVSLNPYGGTDIYASTSTVGNEGESHTKKLETPAIANLNRTNMFFWQDKRVR